MHLVDNIFVKILQRTHSSGNLCVLHDIGERDGEKNHIGIYSFIRRDF